MNTIYNIAAFAPSTAYKKHDIVKYSGTFNNLTLAGKYLYCTTDHTSGATPDAAYWNGVIVANGQIKPIFFWSPNYKNKTTNTPRVRKVILGDGYEKRAEDGLGNKPITYDLSFENRSQSEITAIAHFLDARGAVESFVFTGRIPYIATKFFVCEEFMITEEFENAYTLTCQFREVVN
jgi:phage-related protein